MEKILRAAVENLVDVAKDVAAIGAIAKRAADKAQEAAEGITYSPSWRNEKHKAQWDSTLEAFVYPIIGNTPVGKIDIDAVLSILQPQWLTKS